MRTRPPSPSPSAGATGPAAALPAATLTKNTPTGITGMPPIAKHQRGGGAFNQFDKMSPESLITGAMPAEKFKKENFLDAYAGETQKDSKAAADRRGKPADFTQRGPDGKFAPLSETMGGAEDSTLASSKNDAVGMSFEASRPEGTNTLAFGPSSSAGPASIMGQDEALRMADSRSGTQRSPVVNPPSSGGGTPSRGGAGGGNAVG